MNLYFCLFNKCIKNIYLYVKYFLMDTISREYCFCQVYSVIKILISRQSRNSGPLAASGGLRSGSKARLQRRRRVSNPSPSDPFRRATGPVRGSSTDPLILYYRQSFVYSIAYRMNSVMDKHRLHGMTCRRGPSNGPVGSGCRGAGDTGWNVKQLWRRHGRRQAFP